MYFIYHSSIIHFYPPWIYREISGDGQYFHILFTWKASFQIYFPCEPRLNECKMFKTIPSLLTWNESPYIVGDVIKADVLQHFDINIIIFLLRYPWKCDTFGILGSIFSFIGSSFRPLFMFKTILWLTVNTMVFCEKSICHKVHLHLC